MLVGVGTRAVTSVELSDNGREEILLENRLPASTNTLASGSEHWLCSQRGQRQRHR